MVYKLELGISFLKYFPPVRMFYYRSTPSFALATYHQTIMYAQPT